VGDATAPQVSLFLSFLGLLSTIFLWPIILLVYFTKYEVIHWSNIPWFYLCGTALLNLLFNFFINFGIAFTYPLFISLGIVLGIPVNALADAVIRGKDFGVLKIVAAALIITGFSFMLIPNRYEKKLRDKLCDNERNTSQDNDDEEGLAQGDVKRDAASS
jgi:solute carrier family 35 protein F3/4